jgi:hypothetical protein
VLLAVQLRLIWLEETAVAVNPEGAAGAGAACVFAVAAFDAAEVCPFAEAVTVKL